MSHPYFNAAGLPLAAGNGVANGGQVGGVGGGGDVSAKLEDLHAAAQAAAMAAGHQRASLQWPGIQGLLSNPNFWRDRFNGKTPEAPILWRVYEFVHTSVFNDTCSHLDWQIQTTHTVLHYKIPSTLANEHKRIEFDSW